ncbi:helix-turn-helix domain-containing protein, partial [Acidianus infernus]|uniref:helix-turn-helix domain-containing protein n=1 Tax=Acidianus infernus TaxID=12915 RepID=UPI003592EEE3
MQEEELKEKIKKMYEDGKTIREIAKELNMSYSKVRKILILEGVEFRGKLKRELVNKIIELAKQG